VKPARAWQTALTDVWDDPFLRCLQVGGRPRPIVGAHESELTIERVASDDFQRVASFAVEREVTAQPLWMPNVDMPDATLDSEAHAHDGDHWNQP
jgi:hypothetical protein